MTQRILWCVLMGGLASLTACRNVAGLSDLDLVEGGASAGGGTGLVAVGGSAGGSAVTGGLGGGGNNLGGDGAQPTGGTGAVGPNNCAGWLPPGQSMMLVMFLEQAGLGQTVATFQFDFVTPTEATLTPLGVYDSNPIPELAHSAELNLDGQFALSAYDLYVPPEANTASVEAIVDILINGTSCDLMSSISCGDLSGEITSPISAPLPNSTFTLVPISGPPFPINCNGDTYQ